VSVALDIIEEQPQLREQLWKNTHKMLKSYKEMGYDTGISETPVIPIIIRDNMKVYAMCKLLFENGVFVNPVVSPAVPREENCSAQVIWRPIPKSNWTGSWALSKSRETIGLI